MSEYSPIVYFISAIGTEVIKEFSKQIGKKAYEAVSFFREPILELGISDYSNYGEIQNSLESNPKIGSEIEKKIRDYREDFDHILYVLNQNSNNISDSFNKGGKTTNIGPVYGNIYQNKDYDKKPRNGPPQSLLVLALVIVFFGIVVLAIVAIAFNRKNSGPIVEPSGKINGNISSNDHARSTNVSGNSNTVNPEANVSGQGEDPGLSKRIGTKSPNKKRPSTRSVLPEAVYTPDPCTRTSDPTDGC